MPVDNTETSKLKYLVFKFKRFVLFKWQFFLQTSFNELIGINNISPPFRRLKSQEYL